MHSRALLILLAIAPMIVVAVGWLIARSLDSDRIAHAVRARGWTLIEAKWKPFGPGCLGEKGERIYQITCRDRNGEVHICHVKTSLFTGVYWAGDVPTRRSIRKRTSRSGRKRKKHRRSGSDRAKLKRVLAENRRLKARIAELEGRTETAAADGEDDKI